MNRRSLVLELASAVLLTLLLAAVDAPSVHAQHHALKELSDRCSGERDRAQQRARASCPTNIKARNYRSCMADARAQGTKAFNACMGTTTRGACAAREFAVERQGGQGQADRYCALLDCGYNFHEVDALGIWVGELGYQCRRDAAASGSTQQASTSTSTGATAGRCSPKPGFKNSGWSCNDLRGQVAQFNEWGVPTNERPCNGSELEAVVRAGNVATCTNLVEQGEAVLNKYRSFDMGRCKPDPKIANGGWQCSALEGLASQFVAYNVPAHERICTQDQLDALMRRNDRGNCSNVVVQIQAVVEKYKNGATSAPDATTNAATGTCRPDPKIANGGWQCSALEGLASKFDKYDVPADERICTQDQLDALMRANDRGNCSNVVVQIEAVVDKYKNRAAKQVTKAAPVALSWQALPGAATDIGAGGNRQAWVTNAKQEIFRLSDGRWRKVSGSAKRVAVDGDGNAWVVNRHGQIFQWTQRGWALRPGKLADIGVGADGTVWGINAAQAIYRWQGSNWQRMPGAAVRVSVDGRGIAWVVNAAGAIYTWGGDNWVRRPGAAKDIAACGNGDVYVVGTNDRVYKWNGSQWDRQAGSDLANLACDAQGRLFATTRAQKIFVSTAPAK